MEMGLVHLSRPACTAVATSLEASPGLALLAAGKIVLSVSYGIYEQCGPGCGIGSCSTQLLRAVLQPLVWPPWTLD